MEIPESMRAELGAWNGGTGIDLEGWVQCEGRFALAVGYLSMFWPRLVAFEQYVLREGFNVASLRGFAAREGSTRASVEWVMNHRHLRDFQAYGCEDASRDKFIMLGNVLREVLEVKLKWQFPERRFVVEFHQPDDPEDLDGYQVSFWQSDAP